MGRYKDYDREPKRDGYDEVQRSGDRASQIRANYPSPSVSQASEPVEAIVKRFNAEKEFGFVAVVGGCDAFMHIRQLEAAGHTNVSEGAHIKVHIGQGKKGLEVTEVIEVNARSGRSAERRSATPSQVSCQTKESIGTVKVYKADKGFGFVSQDGGGEDVFVHATALKRGGLSGLAEGQRVRMQIGQGQKGLGAQTIELLD
jgi:CspA family cold shock protein